MYIRFFHGRKHPDEQLDDWGFNGPVIGPLQVSWTYGIPKLHDIGWFDTLHLTVFQDMIKIGEYYYGDFEIWEEGDPIIKHPENQRQLMTLYEFVEKYYPGHGFNKI